jgi:hypothetical protein
MADGSSAPSRDLEAIAGTLVEALETGNAGVWVSLSFDIGRGLTDPEKGALLLAVIKSMPSHLAAAIILDHFSTTPMAGLDPEDHKSNAKWWADEASMPELKAFIWEGVRKLPKSDRVALIRKMGQVK